MREQQWQLENQHGQTSNQNWRLNTQSSCKFVLDSLKSLTQTLSNRQTISHWCDAQMLPCCRNSKLWCEHITQKCWLPFCATDKWIQLLAHNNCITKQSLPMYSLCLAMALKWIDRKLSSKVIRNNPVLLFPSEEGVKNLICCFKSLPWVVVIFIWFHSSD